MFRNMYCLLAVTLMFAILTACGQAGGTAETPAPQQQAAAAQNGDAAAAPAEDSPESITVITSSEEMGLFHALGDRFFEQTGIAVEVIAIGYDSIHPRLVTSVMAGSTDVDLSYVDVIWPAEFAVTEILHPLNEFAGPGFADRFIDVTINQMTYNGQIFAVPYSNNGKWMFYNAAMLQEAGLQPPSTWAELLDVSQQLIDQGIARHGISWALVQSEGVVCDMTTMFNAFGTPWLDSAGNFAFNGPGAVAAMEMIIDTIDTGIADPASITYNDRTALNPFLAGETAFVMNWSFAWDLVNDPGLSAVSGDVNIMLIPGVAEAGTISSGVTGGGGVGMLSTSLHKEAGWQFLYFMATEEAARMGLMYANVLPTLTSIYQDPQLLIDFPFLELFFPQMQHNHHRPMLPRYSEWSSMVQEHLSRIVTGQVSAQDGLNQAVQESEPFRP